MLYHLLYGYSKYYYFSKWIFKFVNYKDLVWVAQVI